MPPGGPDGCITAGHDGRVKLWDLRMSSQANEDPPCRHMGERHDHLRDFPLIIIIKGFPFRIRDFLLRGVPFSESVHGRPHVVCLPVEDPLRRQITWKEEKTSWRFSAVLSGTALSEFSQVGAAAQDVRERIVTDVLVVMLYRTVP